MRTGGAGAVAPAASMSAIAVNLSRGRVPPPRAISASSIAFQPVGVDDRGLAAADQPVQRRRLVAAGVGQQAVVVVGDQIVHRLRRARLVGADEARRAALDPARHIAAAHRRTRRGRPPGRRRWAPPRRRRRTAARESACRGSRSRSAPDPPRAGAPRRHQSRELDTCRRARPRRRASGSVGRPAGSAAA